MRRTVKLIIALALVLSPAMSVKNVIASERSSSVTVSYTPDKIYAFVKLKVEVEGRGEVRDMDQSIRSGSITFDMREGDAKKFEIRPDDGYIIGSVEYFDGYDKKNISSQLTNSMTDIIVRDRDAVLNVRFEKKKSNSETNSGTQKPVIPENHKPNVNVTELVSSSKVQTDDVTNREMVLMLMGISFVLILIILKRRRDSSDE